MSEARLRPYRILAPDRPTARSCSSVSARNSAGSIDGTAASSRSQIAARGMHRDLLADDRAHQPAEARRHLAQLGMTDLLDRAREIGIDLREMPHRLLEVGGIENDLGHDFA